MKILLDECLPRRLRRELPDHEVWTVQDMGWSGVQNGALLRQAVAASFAVFITIDRNLQYQQNFANVALAVIAMRAASNDIAALLPLIDAVRAALESAAPGQIVRVG